MRKTKKLKKEQKMFLLIVIIVLIVFIVILISRTQKEKYVAEKASSDIMDTVEEKEELALENKVQGDSIVVPTDDTSWDEEAEDTKVITDEKDGETIQQNNKSPYYIKINCSANCVTIYKKDSSGKYTIPVKAMVCSTGTVTPTSGVYKMTDKYKWHALYGGVYGQYCSRITGHILFHSVPYTKKSPDSLEYWEYDKLGTTASAGCIRLAVADAMWIYNNCASGTYVEFYSNSTSGPLGKPVAKKISSNTACRNWDPTDSDSRNPWHTYSEPKDEKPKQENNATNQNDIQVPENESNTQNVENDNLTTKPEDNNIKDDTNTNANANTETNENTNSNISSDENEVVNNSKEE